MIRIEPGKGGALLVAHPCSARANFEHCLRNPDERLDRTRESQSGRSSAPRPPIAPKSDGFFASARRRSFFPANHGISWEFVKSREWLTARPAGLERHLPDSAAKDRPLEPRPQLARIEQTKTGVSDGIKEVLLISDDPVAARLIREKLRDEHVSLSGTGDLGAALARLQEKSCDVILLDLELSDSAGLCTLNRFQIQAGNTPIVVLTKEGGDQPGREAVRNGAQDYLVKEEIDRPLLSRALRYAIERKQLEARLRESEERLRRTNGLEALRSMASGVAHDFNNLLTVILGLCAEIVAQLDCQHPARASAMEVEEVAERGSALTRQLLLFCLDQPGDPRVVDLNEILRGAEKMVRRVVGESIQLEMRLAPHLHRVWVDETQMEQVIVNLAVNARDAMPAGGELLIQTGNVALEAVETDSSVRNILPRVTITVKDTGIGMDPTTRRRIFEPYFTTKKNGRIGLGLSTVYDMVRRSGGEITVASDPGRGTTFTIFLPECPESLEGEQPRSGFANSSRSLPTIG